MKYNRLGNTGLLVSELSFGSWVTFAGQVDEDLSYELMKRAYVEHGINFFDNAEAYAAGASETLMGKSIARGVADGTWERSDLVVSTKIFFGTKNGPNARGLSRKHIIEGTQASLKRLQLDYVDLIFCHRPDPTVPIEETVRAMNFVIEKGWAFYWGTSEWSAAELQKAQAVADRLGLIGPAFDQPQYNLFERARVEIEYAPLYKEIGLGLTTWSPLASGILTGKYSGMQIPEGSRLAQESYKWLKDIKFSKAEEIDKTDKLKPVAERLGCSLAQLAIAFCVANPHVSTVILGATKSSQLDENVKALEVVPKLTPEIMADIEAIVGSKPEPHRIHAQVANMRSYTFEPPSAAK